MSRAEIRLAFMEHAIGAETYAVNLFIGLEMQVGGAASDRIQQHFVDETHHWGVVCLCTGIIILACARTGADIQAFQIHVVQSCKAVSGIFE